MEEILEKLNALIGLEHTLVDKIQQGINSGTLENMLAQNICGNEVCEGIELERDMNELLILNVERLILLNQLHKNCLEFFVR